MAPRPSQEWLDAVIARGRERQERPGATATVQFAVGDDRYWVAFDDGRVVDAGLGPSSAADVTLTSSRADADAIERGDLDEQAAYMQGKLKVEGDMTRFLAILPLLADL